MFPITEPSEPRLGYCLPILKEELPQEVQQAGAFVPIPDDPQDAAAARRWGDSLGLTLRHASECDLTPVTRPLAQLPERPQPGRLVKIPEPAPAAEAKPTATATSKAEGEGKQPAAEAVPLQPGGQAMIKGVHSLNVRSGPGVNYRVRGILLPGQVVDIRAGPRQIGHSPWFEIRNPDTGLTGWANGRYLVGVSSASGPAP